jgi:hypothetical protein
LLVTWKYKNISLLVVKTNMLIVPKSQIILKVTPPLLVDRHKGSAYLKILYEGFLVKCEK